MALHTVGDASSSLEPVTLYICHACGEKFFSLEDIEEHKVNNHPNVYCTHLEIEDVKSIPSECLFQYNCSPVGVLHRCPVPPVISPSDDQIQMLRCTKCSGKFEKTVDLHEHILVCGGHVESKNGVRFSKHRFTSGRRAVNRGMKRRLDDDEPNRIMTRTSMPKPKIKKDPVGWATNQSSTWKSDANDDVKFVCDGCNRCFKYHYALERHQKFCMTEMLEIGRANASKDIRKQHSCPYCSRSFTYPASLQKHMAEVCQAKLFISKRSAKSELTKKYIGLKNRKLKRKTSGWKSAMPKVAPSEGTQPPPTDAELVSGRTSPTKTLETSEAPEEQPPRQDEVEAQDCEAKAQDCEAEESGSIQVELPSPVKSEVVSERIDIAKDGPAEPEAKVEEMLLETEESAGTMEQEQKDGNEDETVEEPENETVEMVTVETAETAKDGAVETAQDETPEEAKDEALEAVKEAPEETIDETPEKEKDKVPEVSEDAKELRIESPPALPVEQKTNDGESESPKVQDDPVDDQSSSSLAQPTPETDSAKRDHQHTCPNCKRIFTYLANFKKHLNDLCPLRHLDKKNARKDSQTEAAATEGEKGDSGAASVVTGADENEETVTNKEDSSDSAPAAVPESIEVESSSEAKLSSHSCTICHKVFGTYVVMLKHRLSHKLKLSAIGHREHSPAEPEVDDSKRLRKGSHMMKGKLTKEVAATKKATAVDIVKLAAAKQSEAGVVGEHEDENGAVKRSDLNEGEVDDEVDSDEIDDDQEEKDDSLGQFLTNPIFREPPKEGQVSISVSAYRNTILRKVKESISSNAITPSMSSPENKADDETVSTGTVAPSDNDDINSNKSNDGS